MDSPVDSTISRMEEIKDVVRPLPDASMSHASNVTIGTPGFTATTGWDPVTGRLIGLLQNSLLTAELKALVLPTSPSCWISGWPFLRNLCNACCVETVYVSERSATCRCLRLLENKNNSQRPSSNSVQWSVSRDCLLIQQA